MACGESLCASPPWLRAWVGPGGHQDAITFRGQLGGYRGGYGFSPRDVARLGLLLLEDGVWHGRRLLPAEWVAAARRPQVAAGVEVNRDKAGQGAWNSLPLTLSLPFDPAGHPGRMGGDLGYGFSLWIMPDGEAFHMSGKMGNYVIMDPRSGLLVVVSNNAETHPCAADYLAAVRSALHDGGGRQR